MFSKKCFCKENISKIVRPLLAALSINGLKQHIPLFSFQMLHCIIDMVDKTKRALNVLQERSTRDREELQMWMRRHAEGLDQDMKKRTSELMATTLRQTEDRVTEVKRRAGTID